MYLFVLTCDFNMELVQYSAARIEIINFIILRKVIFNKKQMYNMTFWLKLYLILTQGSTKSPYACEGEVGLIELTWRVRWDVLWSEEAIQQSAESLKEQKQSINTVFQL